MIEKRSGKARIPKFLSFLAIALLLISPSALVISGCSSSDDSSTTDDTTDDPPPKPEACEKNNFGWITFQNKGASLMDFYVDNELVVTLNPNRESGEYKYPSNNRLHVLVRYNPSNTISCSDTVFILDDCESTKIWCDP